MQIYSCFLGLLTCYNVFTVLPSNSKVNNPSDLFEKDFFFFVILALSQLIKKLESNDIVGEKLVKASFYTLIKYQVNTCLNGRQSTICLPSSNTQCCPC